MCIYSGSRGKSETFVLETSRSLALYFAAYIFLFLGAKYCNIFYDCNSLGGFGEVFAHGGEFPLSFLIVVGLGHGVDNYCWPVTVVTVF